MAAGAEIVNDVSGFLWDETMASTCAELAVWRGVDAYARTP